MRLAFRYTWNSGEQFGFIRRCELVNLDDAPVQVEVVDGLQNLLPSRLGSEFQLRYSNLGNAYKKSERLPKSSLGVYYLSSIPTDRAEPSEGLRATVAWQTGLPNSTVAISNKQLHNLHGGASLTDEYDVRGCCGAYFVSTQVQLEPLKPIRWNLITDTNYDHASVIRLDEQIRTDERIEESLERDIASGEAKLLEILSAADGRQLGASRLRVQRHQSNVLFNVMRGGIPAHGYEICTEDFRSHVRNSNRLAEERNQSVLGDLPSKIQLDVLRVKIRAQGDVDLIRIASEYLPLCFSRRHGDPTRPWNKFSIDLRSDDGSESLNYQGNWRDIFQNWEALSVAFPSFATSMVTRFVNATTADGYNPYRVTKDGLDWEVPDPNDPWSNIGYWGDHQIIYLLKLLQWCQAMTPTHLNESLCEPTYAYANIPYRIRSYEAISADPQVTIDYDHSLASEIDSRVSAIGGDGKLLLDASGAPLHVNLVEKLLVTLLAKLTNFVPEGGIWLNTQRPEWNDANNALVGRGLSVVTVCYLRRYLSFLIEWFSSLDEPSTVRISGEVAQLTEQVKQVLDQYAGTWGQSLDDQTRKQILDALATAGSDYRKQLYTDGMGGDQVELNINELVGFFRQAREMVDHTIRQNRRRDGMYHSYNLMNMEPDSCSVSHLYEMLEGQVAVLSSGALSPQDSLQLLDSL